LPERILVRAANVLTNNFRGFNKNGVPTKEFLHEMDMDYVGEDLELRGIYNG
jgi:hypothetical protein